MIEDQAVEMGEHALARLGLHGYAVKLADLHGGKCGWCVNGVTTVWLDRSFVRREPIVTVRDVCLHEAAHVLSGCYDHGDGWRAMATQIGCVHAAFYLQSPAVL
jgi:hypothetical protein